MSLITAVRSRANPPSSTPTVAQFHKDDLIQCVGISLQQSRDSVPTDLCYLRNVTSPKPASERYQ